jgi:hypothetical protein
MNIFKKILKFLEITPDPNRNSVIKCKSIPDLISLISSTTEHDKKYVYIFKGELNLVANIVSNQYSRGEREISNLSLLYPDFDRYDEKNNCIVLGEAFLMPCLVSDLKHSGATRIRYVNAKGKSYEMKYAAICNENIYLTSK